MIPCGEMARQFTPAELIALSKALEISRKVISRRMVDPLRECPECRAALDPDWLEAAATTLRVEIRGALQIACREKTRRAAG